MTDTLKELDSWVDACIEEFKLEDMDSSDYAHECADGCEWAIYYSKAWDLVAACRDHRTDMLDEADSSYSDVFPNDDAGIDTHMSRLAYLIAHYALCHALEGKS